jgi:pyrroloquinoline quinone biosynthesis protein E
VIQLAARPSLRHARLRRRGDRVLLLAPERGLLLGGSAPAILELVDGERRVRDIIDELERTHAEDAGAIGRDVVALFDALVRQRLLWMDGDGRAAPAAGADPSPVPASGGPMTLIAELTYACPLRCAYCSNPVGLGEVPAALCTADWLRVLDQASALGAVQLHLSGGEPLLRGDLEELVAGARARDYYVNLITSGVPLRRDRLAALRAAGLDSVQLSFQDATGALAARIAGTDRHRAKLTAAAWVRELGLPLTINVVLHAVNIDEVSAIIALAEHLGADRLELANTQYLGWALLNRDALLPSAEQIARAREIAAEARERLAGRMELLFVLPDLHRGRPRACMGGWGQSYLLVAPDGLALPCHAARDLPLEFWNVRDHAVSAIWRDAPGFQAFRGEDWMAEPCRSCERRAEDFGGCRCQAFALTGDAAAPDPACELVPSHDLVRVALSGARPPVALRHRSMRPRGAVSGPSPAR